MKSKPMSLIKEIDRGYRHFCRKRGIKIVDDFRTLIRAEAEVAMDERKKSPRTKS